jgi:hypothetical protein
VDFAVAFLHFGFAVPVVAVAGFVRVEGVKNDRMLDAVFTIFAGDVDSLS